MLYNFCIISLFAAVRRAGTDASVLQYVFLMLYYNASLSTWNSTEYNDWLRTDFLKSFSQESTMLPTTLAQMVLQFIFKLNSVIKILPGAAVQMSGTTNTTLSPTHLTC